MTESFEQLCFPSGRSVPNCRKDAKRLAKQLGIAHHQALDQVAAANGIDLPWNKALASLANQAFESLPERSGGMTSRDIHRVMAKYAELTHFGFGIYGRTDKSPDEAAEVFAWERASLAKAIDECNRAAYFLRFLDKRQTINTASSSYGFKHLVERLFEALSGSGNDCYVANGSFICAALHFGFDILPVRSGSPNVFFNFSSRSPVYKWQALHGRSRALLRPAQLAQLQQLEQQLGIPQSGKQSMPSVNNLVIDRAGLASHP